VVPALNCWWLPAGNQHNVPTYLPNQFVGLVSW
jgi:hypothetical protein